MQSLSLRDNSIDALRGIAIVTMACANSAAYALAEPHPFWLRVYGSFAAPLFIALSGLMVQQGFLRKNRSFSFFLKRTGLILLTAALIDILLWRTYPFTTVDVLYLIGISTPVIYLLRNADLILRCVLILLLFISAPILQQKFGYTNYPTEYYLTGEITVASPNQTNIINHWLIDGWFPLFPWLGFSLLGSALAELKQDCYRIKITSFKFFIFGIALLATGSLLWKAIPTAHLTRAGYSELFYPPTLAYCLCATGVLLILFYIVSKFRIIGEVKPLRLLGECSLFMYILHLVLISYIIEPLFPSRELKTFLWIYLVLLIVLITAAAGIHQIKKKLKKTPYPLRFLIGG